MTPLERPLGSGPSTARGAEPAADAGTRAGASSYRSRPVYNVAAPPKQHAAHSTVSTAFHDVTVEPPSGGDSSAPTRSAHPRVAPAPEPALLASESDDRLSEPVGREAELAEVGLGVASGEGLRRVASGLDRAIDDRTDVVVHGHLEHHELRSAGDGQVRDTPDSSVVRTVGRTPDGFPFAEGESGGVRRSAATPLATRSRPRLAPAPVRVLARVTVLTAAFYLVHAAAANFLTAVAFAAAVLLIPLALATRR